MAALPILIKDQRAIKVNLFKKSQIGGTREIFILTMVGRLAINFVETISRTICHELPGEMLTKGSEKVKVVDSHYAATMAGSGGVITRSTSSDAATWCQQFVMPVFFAVLFPVLPDEFIGIVARVLNMVTRKELELPHDLLALFQRHPNVRSHSAETEELKRQFMSSGGERDLVRKAGSRFLMNRSNMMQGILHYTSSLLHGGALQFYTAIIDRHIRKVLHGIVKDVLVTHQYSSARGCRVPHAPSGGACPHRDAASST